MDTQKKELLRLEDVTVKISNLTLVNQASFSLFENERLLIVGPNGAGKSTLVNAMTRAVTCKGNIFMEGQNIADMKTTEIARFIGVLSQTHNVGYSFTVEEIVRLGRYAYAPNFFSQNKEDAKFVEEALEMTGLTGKKNQSVVTLSGGEIQRTFLAQVFAQDPRVLVLDEPTNHLDIQYQKQIFSLIRNWMLGKKKAVVAVVHDLSLASFFGTRFILMDKGNMAAVGSREEVFSSDLLNRVYNMDVREWMKTLYQQWFS
jgi:iron complex transport system ATP-binding protein